MVTFFVGIALLLVGGFLYGKYCEKVFGPDDRETPAITERDGVDYVPMKKWKNSLIELLNIAGTGPPDTIPQAIVTKNVGKYSFQ